MNRITHLFEDETPSDYGLEYKFEHNGCLYDQYLEDPANLVCPICGPDCMSVISFFDPETYANNEAFMVEPVGTYAVVLHCHKCKRSVGLVLHDSFYH